jgi:diacylglycerol kinase family enzyme
MQIQPSSNFDVVLNQNAGRVTPGLVDRLSQIVPSNRIHLTTSLLHSRDVVQECIERGSQTIFAGGGDGTIVDVVNTVHEFATDHTPTIGVLRLGTGNALAHWLGSSSPEQDLRRWMQKQEYTAVEANMVEAEETLFPFAGIGIDAAVLNDYNLTKRHAKDKWYGSILKGITGYIWAAHTRTLPNYLKNPKQYVRITNLGRPAFRIGPNGGEIGEPIPTGAVLYEGEVSTVTAASTPFYGYKMKMFPFATQRKGRFQLRVVEMSPLQIARHIYSAWNGELRHPQLLDYYVDRVRVEFEQAMPYQLGGEATGFRKEVVFSLASRSTKMLGYH